MSDDDKELNLADIAEEVRRNNGANYTLEAEDLTIVYPDPLEGTLHVRLTPVLDSKGTIAPVVFVEHMDVLAQYRSGAVLHNCNVETVVAIIVAMLLG